MTDWCLPSDGTDSRLQDPKGYAAAVLEAGKDPAPPPPARSSTDDPLSAPPNTAPTSRAGRRAVATAGSPGARPGSQHPSRPTSRDSSSPGSGDSGLGAAPPNNHAWTSHARRNVISADHVPKRNPALAKVHGSVHAHTHTQPSLSPDRGIQKPHAITIMLRKPLGITLLTHGHHCYVGSAKDGGGAATEFGRHDVGPDSGLRFKFINGHDVHISGHDVASALKAGGRTGTVKIVFALDPVGHQQAKEAKEQGTDGPSTVSSPPSWPSTLRK